VDGPATLWPAVGVAAAPGATPVAAAVVPVGEEFPLGPGDRIAYVTDTPLTFRNAGVEPVSLLAITLLPAGDGAPAGSVPVGSPEPGAGVGITSALLGRAIVDAAPSGLAAVTLERFSLTPGGRLTAYPGPALLAVESGSIGGTVVEGAVEVAAAGTQGAIATPGAAFNVGAGQALFFPGGWPRPPTSAAPVGSISCVSACSICRSGRPRSPRAPPPPPPPER